MNFHGGQHSVHDKKTENLRFITSCCLGNVITLEKLSNDAFSSLILGDGFGVIPSANEFVAPVSGEVKDVSANSHEITVKTPDNMLIMVSVEPQEPACELDISALVASGDTITQGQPLWNVVQPAAELMAAVIVTNSDSLPSFNIRYGKVTSFNQPVMTITV